MTRPADQANGLRRPLWFKRPLKPDEKAYYLDNMDENGRVKKELD